jgi:hypothetical protein
MAVMFSALRALRLVPPGRIVVLISLSKLLGNIADRRMTSIEKSSDVTVYRTRDRKKKTSKDKEA